MVGDKPLRVDQDVVVGPEDVVAAAPVPPVTRVGLPRPRSKEPRSGKFAL